MEAVSSWNDSLSAYADYPTFLRDHQEDFGWLYEFLRRPGPVPGKTGVVFGESLNQSLKLKHSNDMEYIQKSLQESDSKRGGGGRLRLLLLYYRESWSFDRKVLKAVVENYAIPPMFFGCTSAMRTAGATEIFPKTWDAKLIFARRLKHLSYHPNDKHGLSRK